MKCDISQILGLCYYRTNGIYENKCVKCSKKRIYFYQKSGTAYLKSKFWTKKPTGLMKFPLKLRINLKEDHKNGLNIKQIYLKHKNEYPKLNYNTLLFWNKKGLFN